MPQTPMGIAQGGFNGMGTNQYLPASQLQVAQDNYLGGQNKAQRESDQGIAAGRNAAATQQAQIGANASMYPAQLAQGRFNTMFPLISGAFGSLSDQLNGQQGAPGSSGGAPPKIDAAPVWTPSQVQGQVNSQVAGNDAQTAGNIRQNAQGLAGRGFGGRSPLLAELTAQSQGQGMQANNQVRQAVPFNAAQGNSQQLLAGQQAQQKQYQSGQQNIIQRQQIAQQQQSSLLSALSNLAR